MPAGEATITVSANPLPQALILTAIVISFSLAAFTVALFEAAHRRLGTLDSDEMRWRSRSTIPGRRRRPRRRNALRSPPDETPICS